MSQNIGANSSTFGDGTIAISKNQTVIGSYNLKDISENKNPNEKGQYAFIVGNGINEANRSNAHTIDWDGNAQFAGNIEANGAKFTNDIIVNNIQTNNKLVFPTADVKTNGMSLISFYDNAYTEENKNTENEEILCGVIGADNSVHYSTYLINYKPYEILDENQEPKRAYYYNGYLLPPHSGKSEMFHFLTTKEPVAIENGGTGLNQNPKMLVDLSSTDSDEIFKESSAPGIKGTLPITNGGTGATSKLDARKELGIPGIEIKQEIGPVAPSEQPTITFFNNHIQCIILTAYIKDNNGMAFRSATGMWTISNNGSANNLYALYATNDYRTTVYINNNHNPSNNTETQYAIAITNGTSNTNLYYTIVALTE